jgi:ribosomal protein L37AE/L43A
MLAVRHKERIPLYKHTFECPHCHRKNALVANGANIHDCEHCKNKYLIEDEAPLNAIANAVVDPTAVRKSIGEPTDPEVDEISVPGGTLQVIRTEAWARRIMPDPRNPRILPSRRHPFAIDPGTGGEDAKFRPIPEPRCSDCAFPQIASLTVDVESRHHLTWASQQAATYVLAENDWRLSIASQGVMEAVYLVATTYEHSDGSAPAVTVTTPDGSSRITGVHSLLKIRSADVPYDDNEGKLRTHIRKLNGVATPRREP